MKKWNAMFLKIVDDTKFGGAVTKLEDRKTIQRNFLTCWRNEPRSPHKVCLRKVQSMSCPWESSSACWMPIEVGSFAVGRKKRGKTERQKERSLHPVGQVGYGSVVRACNDWSYPDSGPKQEGCTKRFRFLLSIWETTSGAPEPLLGSQHKKEGIGKLAQVPSNWRKASKTTMGLQHPALKEWGRCQAHSASQRKQAGWVKTANIHSGYPFIQRGIQPWTKYMLLQDAQQKDNSDNQKKNKK